MSLLFGFGRLSYANAMLPILRILPVGGVLLAVTLLVLALSPLDGSRTHLRPNVAPVHGAMIERNEHPEWRQFLILAAIKRADELNRLRDLPDTPTITAMPPAPAAPTKPVAATTEPAKVADPSTPKLAGLPTERSDTDPGNGDTTGSIAEQPSATIPIDIGETSAFELPVAAPEEKPPVIRTPQRSKAHNESGVRTTRHRRRISAAKPDTLASVSILALIFGPQPPRQPPAANAKKN